MNWAIKPQNRHNQGDFVYFDLTFDPNRDTLPQGKRVDEQVA